jgi:hypothetical protein
MVRTYLQTRREKQAAGDAHLLAEIGWPFSDEDLAGFKEQEAEEQREIDEHWARVAATPCHKRDLLSIEEHLTPPVSRWDRVVYYALVPVVLVAALGSNVALSALR